MKRSIVLFLFFVYNLYGSPIVIDENFSATYIGTNIVFMEEPLGKLNLSDIQKLTNWKQSSNNFLNFGFKKTTLWMKFHIQNKTKQSVYFSTEYPKYDSFILYQPTENGTYSSYKVSSTLPFQQRQVKNPFVTFYITNAITGDYYIRSVAKNFPFQMFPQLQSEKKYFQKKLLNDWSFLFYLFGMGFFIIISLFYFFVSREQEFLFQILYIVLWVFFQLSFLGYGFQYVWTRSGFVDQYIFIISMHLVGMLTALLYRYYLDLKQNFPLIDKYVARFIFYPIVIGLLLIFILPYRIMLIMSLLLACYTMASEFILGIILIKKRKILAILLFVGFLGVQIGAGLSILGSFHLYTNWAVMRWSNYIGNFWVVLFLFLTLSYKYRIYKSKLHESEKQLHLSYFSMENALDSALWLTGKGKFIYANKSMIQMLGYSKEEILTLHPWDIIKNLSFQKWKNLWNKLKTEKSLINEFVLLAKNGTEILVEGHANFFYYDHREYNFIFMHDIRKKIENQKKLKENERNLAITLNSIGDGVIVTDAESRITRMNPVAEKLTGWNLSDATGKKLETIFHIINNNSKEEVENPVRKIMTTGKIVGLANHTVLISKDNKEYHIADSGAPIIDNEKIIGVVIVFRDITQEYRLQNQLRHAQTLQSLGQLAGGIAHDFNNILMGILANAELIKTECQDENIKKMAESIMHLSERGGLLSKNLLSFSSKSETNKKKENFTSILEDVINIVENTIDKRITIHKNVNEKEPYYVFGDIAQLHSAILNIALNAKDALHNKGEIYFELKTKYLDANFCKQHIIENTEGDYVVLSITDTGEGILEENLNKIFDPFFTTKRLGHGTGLGLSITYNIIKQHQGGISVYSEIGKGTTFRIYLKLVDNPKIQKTVPLVEKGQGTILIVDDEKDILLVLEKMLEKLGYEVKTQNSYKKVLQFYANNYKLIDIVLLDYLMPEKTGLEMFQEMKKINPDIKAIIMSGFSQNLEKQDILKMGIQDFIAKPFNLTEISHKLKKIIKIQ